MRPYAPTSTVIMGPYGPYVNGRPVNGGYNPYRRTSTTQMYRPTSTMRPYVVTRPVPRPMPSVCSYNGKTYKKGETFFKGCSAKCTCMGGPVACLPVCPAVAPFCGGGRKMAGYETKPVAGSKCTCRVPKCVVIPGIIMPPVPRPLPTVCSYNGKTYRRGQTFLKGCMSRCTCFGGAIRCLPVCPMVAPGCGGGRKMAGYEMKPVAGSKCKCRVPKCVVINGIIMPTNVLQPPASSDTRFIGIPSSLVPYPLSVIPPKPDPVGGKCGGNYKISKKGTIIKSPSSNYHYPRFAKCTFRFIAPKGKRVKITFLEMNMEGGKKCLFDSVTIMEKGKKVAKICGNTERGYTLKGRAGTIIFKSDGSVQKNGFKAKLTAV